MERIEDPAPAIPGEADPIAELLGRALQGDEASLGVFFTLLETRYGRLVVSRLRRRTGPGHTATLDDVLQQASLRFLGEIRTGLLPELGPLTTESIVGHFQRLADRSFDAHRKGKHALRERSRRELHENLDRDARVSRTLGVPGLVRPTEDHRKLLRSAIAELPASDRELLEAHLDGTPYAELSRRTGKSELALRPRVCRLKQSLAARLAELSQTARLAQEGRKAPRSAAQGSAPTKEDLEAALATLPRELREAVRAVHLEGEPAESLAARLGDRGAEKARARLARAYAALEARFGVPFPASFPGSGDA